MRRRTSLTTATCALAAATLLLTACGGGGDDKKIGAEDSGTSAPAPSASTTTAAPTTSAPAGPTFDFPPDVKVVVDADTTGDAVKDAVLRDQGYGLNSVYVALGKDDPDEPLLQKYLTGTALEIWSESISAGKKQHLTATGDLHFYNRKVTSVDAKTAGVTFCEDQRYSYNKHTDTGRIDKTTPSLNSFVSHTAFMRKAADGTWQMADYKSQRGAASCRVS
ncbi:hypothetical protein [Streptomyces sp. NPDC021020]|uniref:hypothetical protein n=1 Tax=Streptomyces sp. NPDC021020 TaxID=3365109 RepID=UPI0037A20B09